MYTDAPGLPTIEPNRKYHYKFAKRPPVECTAHHRVDFPAQAKVGELWSLRDENGRVVIAWSIDLRPVEQTTLYLL